LASRQVCLTTGFRTRTASLQDITPRVLEAFAEGFLLQGEGRVASLGGLVKKLEKLVGIFKKAPKTWEKIKQFLGIEGITDLPKAIKEWAKKGLDALKQALKKATQVFPLSLYFVPHKKMPGLSDLVERIMARNPNLAKIIQGVKNLGAKADAWLDKYLPTLRRPLLAAIFIYIWLNVVEISWDLEFLLEGFSGGISVGALLTSLPESGLGFLLAGFGLGYWSLPVALMARIIWLVANEYLEWVPEKGLRVRWDKITDGKETRPEVVPVF
jgi:hypothetical protein